MAFNGTASSDPAGISGFSWDFGDGQTATGATANHAYSFGVYSVTLTVTGTDMRISRLTQVVTVDRAPSALFTSSPSLAAPGAPVSFNATGSR